MTVPTPISASEWLACFFSVLTINASTFPGLEPADLLHSGFRQFFLVRESVVVGQRQILNGGDLVHGFNLGASVKFASCPDLQSKNRPKEFNVALPPHGTDLAAREIVESGNANR